MNTSCDVCEKTFSRLDALKRHQLSHKMKSHIFHCPASIMISGCTSSGKTTFVKKLLEHPELFEPPPQKILYCYGAWQPLFEDMKSTFKDIEFHGGLPDSELITNFVDGNHNIVVLDDLMSDIVKDEDIQQLFTRGSHHMNLTILYLTQNAFCQGKCARTISLNCAYLVLFKNPRDIYQIQLMGRQIGLPNTLPEAYDDCMEEKYGYLVVDLSPHHVGLPRLWSHVFPEEDRIQYVKI